MKKIVAILALVVCTAISASAQLIPSGGSFSAGSNPYRTSKDTVTDAGTKTYTQKVSQRFQTVTLQMNYLKISGTPTSSYMTLYGCADTGNTYVPLYVDTLASASRGYSHTFTGNPYTAYKWVITGAGTWSGSFQSWLLVR